MNLDELYKTADDNTQELNKRTEGKKGRHEKLLDCNRSKTVIFRMFPDCMGERAITHLPYSNYSFTSPVDGKGVYLGISPTLFGREDFVRKYQGELWSANPEEAKLLFPKERGRVNIFVLEDSEDEDAKGTFKVWDYSAKQPQEGKPRTGAPFIKFLNKIKADEEIDSSSRMLYSLEKEGITIKMTIEKGDGPNDFPQFEFEIYHGPKNKIFDKNTEAKVKKIYQGKGTNLLEMFEEPPTDEELEKTLNKRLLGLSTQSPISSRNTEPDLSDDEDDDDIPMDFGSDDDTPEPKVSKPKEDSSSDDDDDEPDFEKMMAEFEKED